MAVYKVGKYWKVQFMFKRKNYVQSSRSTRKEDAIELERQMRNKLIDGKLHRIQGITLYEAIDRYLRKLKKRKTPFTNRWKSYWSDREFDELTTTDYIKFIEDERARGIADSTLRFQTIHFGAMIKYIKKLGFKFPDIELPKFKIKQKAIRFLTDEEESRIIFALRENDLSANSNREDAYDYLIVMLDTGMRPGEADRLKWSDIDLNNKTLHIYRHKVGNESILPLTDRLYQVLKQRETKKKNQYVFASLDKKTHKSHGNVALQSAFERAGVKNVSPHILRKTFATRLVSAGVPIFTVSKMLGHSSVAITERTYGYLVPDRQFNIAITKLNELHIKGKQLKIVGGKV